MVPSLLQLVRRGRGHLDAASWSCEILQSSPPCEDSTYYATEKSICSGRHPPKKKKLPPLLHPSLPLSRQPPWLSAKWAACQIVAGFTLPLTGWKNEFTALWCNEPTCTPAVSLLNRHICHLGLTLHNSTFLELSSPLKSQKRSTLLCIFSKTKFPSKKAKEPLTWSRVHSDTLMCRWTACGVNQLLMHADRHGSDGVSLPPFHQFPRTFALINAVHLFEMRCDRPVSFHYSISEQTVMLSGPLLVFYQQVLMLL